MTTGFAVTAVATAALLAGCSSGPGPWEPEATKSCLESEGYSVGSGAQDSVVAANGAELHAWRGEREVVFKFVRPARDVQVVGDDVRGTTFVTLSGPTTWRALVHTSRNVVSYALYRVGKRASAERALTSAEPCLT